MTEYREDSPSLYAEKMEMLAIPAHLRSIEQEHHVKILLAVESGSRAWGFESANSDWDVRFIYVHKPEWYFKVEEQRDVIEHMYEDDVDLVGWELGKALALFRKSNPSLLEWFNSPIVYYADDDFVRRIREVEKDYFNPVKSMYHYNHMYNKDNERYLQKEDCDMKRFLYYLRGILACKWIESNSTLPPVSFKELLDATIDDEMIKAKVDELLRIKKSGEEHDMQVVDKTLVEYAHRWADYYNEMIGSFRPEQHKTSTDALDAILYDMVKENA
ncbi:MAG: nucleotidyltransferase domain-containing protein [Prevotella sp.]|nr:nucleotidyltransferase domain-containing protein [Prevotella sp.]